MKTLHLLLLAVLLHASDACGQSIRVATYNLNWANGRGDAVLNAIKTAKPDLICFQETTVESERFLRDRLAESHPHFHATGHEGRYAAERLAFASKFKLAEVKFTPPDAGLFGFYSATLEHAGDAIHVINVHLTPLQIRRGSGLLGAMAALSATEETHAKEIAAITEVIDTRRPTLVVGDFNSLSTFNAPKRLVELGFVDAYASVHEDAEAHPTWYWPTRPLPLAVRIDYIFHTPHFTTREAMVIRREGSDHSLVVAELRLGEPAEAAERAAKPAPNASASPPTR